MSDNTSEKFEGWFRRRSRYAKTDDKLNGVYRDTLTYWAHEAYQFALSQPAQSAVVPSGFRWAPIEPTDEMLDAAARASMQHLIDCINDPSKADEIGSEENIRKTHASRYRSMLAAAPSVSASQTAEPSIDLSDFDEDLQLTVYAEWKKEIADDKFRDTQEWMLAWDYFKAGWLARATLPSQSEPVSAEGALPVAAWMKEHKFHPPTFTTDKAAVESWDKSGQSLIPLVRLSDAAQMRNATPTGDQLRAIAKEADNMSGPSDATSPQQYVLAGWKAALKSSPQVAQEPAQAQVVAIPNIAQMVNRFLGWKLPQDFYPDAGISFDRSNVEKWGMPIGTNLFTADQAKAMFEYVLAASPVLTQPSEPDHVPDAAKMIGKASELPLLPHTTYNGYSDGSEPLYTEEQMRDYGLAARAAQEKS